MRSMHSFDRYLIAALLVLALHPRLSAQGQDGRDGTASPAGEPVDAVPASKAAISVVGARYTALHEQDLLAINSTASTPEDFRSIIDRYWSFVRRYPTSGYADNALWQAANLSAESFRRFSQDRDKNRAVQLLQWLRDQYPHSSLRGFALSRLTELDMASAAVSATPTMAPVAPEASAPVAPPVAASSPAVPPGAVTIRAVQREVLAEVVRVTVELDRRGALFSGADRGSGTAVFRSQRHEDGTGAGRRHVPLQLRHHSSHPPGPASEYDNAHRSRSRKRQPLQRVYSVQPLSHRDRRRAC